ncbi:transglutaminase-like putative cysteine protease [Pseudorhizobium tarimense]|uniref:Transglutaminase-like putative cysteine protease n=1 Tax=Pseudorhizobium tarimense TaxID=1079109 RepID=A0ABV2HCI5_9HYPH|nr:transglutaminase family protein [Pseudorhizobium tarimense]MCJ8521320.1 transglutaminase family protein [Pseudorhizobium tarimense]
MRYDLSLHMSYAYDVPASNARHMIRLLPLEIPGRQTLLDGSIDVSPSPEDRTTFTDFFGQPATSILLRAPHGRLDIRMQAQVLVEDLPAPAEVSTSLQDLPKELAAIWSLDPASPHHLAAPSARTPDVPEISAFAKEMARPEHTIREVAVTLCDRIHREFVYDGNATTVETMPQEAFRLRRGVCQDFAHVMIVALRSLGIPAGYVSGFLRTIPPPGQERLEGADAMHAWVRVWCGEPAGYLELDPTNNIPAGTDHIVVAYGRDYADIAPVVGVLKGYGTQKIEQAVDVVPLD